MASLFGFPPETALLSLPSTSLLPTHSSPKHSSFPAQRIFRHGFACIHSTFLPSANFQAQAKPSSSEDPTEDDNKSGRDLYGADRSGSRWDSSLLSENVNANKPSRISSAFQRAAAYKKGKASGKPAERPSVPLDNIPNQDGSKSGTSAEKSSNISQTAALQGFKEAEDQKQQTGELVSTLEAGLDQAKEEALEENTIEIEIITRDGVIKRRAPKPGKNYSNAKEFKKQGMDFVGLDFSERKKKSGLPAGLSAGIMAPPSKGIPEVEIITKDGDQSAKQLDSNEELYKPKVSTWGVFPRPANISKTYGGGRIIKPGEPLETADETKAREAKTQRLLSEYRKKMGLDLDPVIKEKCEKIMERGNELLDCGKLREAWSCFEHIMGQVTFVSELHGLAALQGAVCLDSLNRSTEAKLMYEKLASHPNEAVKRKARQLLFSFRAMEKMKFSASNEFDTSGYRKYFNAFSFGYDSYNTAYRAPKPNQIDNLASEQIWPYALFISFPLLFMLILVILNG